MILSLDVDGLDGNAIWGLNSTDSAQTVILDTKLQTVEQYNTSPSNTKKLYTTGSVDKELNNELGSQR